VTYVEKAWFFHYELGVIEVEVVGEEWDSHEYGEYPNDSKVVIRALKDEDGYRWCFSQSLDDLDSTREDAIKRGIEYHQTWLDRPKKDESDRAAKLAALQSLLTPSDSST